MTAPKVSAAESAAASEESRYGEPPNRLFQVAAGVLIVAGVVFVVAVVFFAGLVVGRSSGDHGGYGYGYGAHGRFMGPMGPGARAGTCPMMSGGGMMSPTPSQTPIPRP